MDLRIKPILKNEDISFIYHSALRTLHEVGIKCDHTGVLDLLGQKSRAVCRNGRIHFNIDELDEYFSGLKEEIRRTEKEKKESDDAFTMGGCWNCLELCDPDTNKPRPALYDESVKMAKLSEALGSPGSPIPVSPGDIDPRLRTLVSEKIALIHTRKMGNWLTATDRDEIRIIADMHKAAGRKYKLGLEGLITPLKINAEVYDTYFEWCNDPDVEIGIMGGIPVAGSTSPLVFPANLVLPLAEGIALDFISKILSDGKTRCFDFRMEIFDMKYANLAFGTPEHCLSIQAQRELREGLFGIKPRGGTFRTNGKTVDGQTLIERTASFVWQAMLGSRRFSSVGQLSIDEVFSPVQAVLDREILRYGQRLFGGVSEACWDRQTDAVELIAQGAAENGFLTHDSTVEVFRSFFSFDRMSPASNLAVCKGKGSRSLEALAREDAERIIASHDFELPDTTRKDVEKLFEKGAALLCK